MLTSVQDFIRYFEGVNRRALRDVAALPPEADGWRPARGAGEQAWEIGQLVGHIVDSRRMFLSVYRATGWRMTLPKPLPRDRWVPELEASGAELVAGLAETPDEWLQRRIPAIDGSDATLAGWRALMNMVEHEVHHRSQIDTYAGLNGWHVPQIFNRTAEEVAEISARTGDRGPG
ncbi:MAG: DinB family protein [Candidatus Dormibacteria bacterium]